MCHNNIIRLFFYYYFFIDRNILTTINKKNGSESWWAGYTKRMPRIVHWTDGFLRKPRLEGIQLDIATKTGGKIPFNYRWKIDIRWIEINLRCQWSDYIRFKSYSENFYFNFGRQSLEWSSDITQSLIKNRNHSFN